MPSIAISPFPEHESGIKTIFNHLFNSPARAQLTTRGLTTPLNLLILTSYFAMEPDKVRGGIGNRYAGLYGSLAKILLGYSSDSKVLILLRHALRYVFCGFKIYL